MDNFPYSRTAAVLLSRTQTDVSLTSIIKKYIQVIFLNNDNKPLLVEQIIELIAENFDLNFELNVISNVLIKNRTNFEKIDQKGKIKYKVFDEKFNSLKSYEVAYNISTYIEIFVETECEGSVDKLALKNGLLLFIYELLNKNIEAFKKLIDSKFKTKDLTIDSQKFSKEQLEVINKFLNWDHSEKNKSIFNIVSYAVEYCLITNNLVGSKTNILKSIREKQFYIDNNIIYRAIGINGKKRQQRTKLFFKKCVEQGQNFLVSVFTVQEFNATIKYNIENLKRVTHNKINPKIFGKYTSNPSLYEFYHEWRLYRRNKSVDDFEAHLKANYKDLLVEFNIKEDYNIPFNLEDEKIKEKLNAYATEIGNYKENGNSNSEINKFDARNLLLTETKRGNNNLSISDTKYYFISADKKLRDWDFKRNDKQPIAIFPSQWLSIIFKFFTRSNDDYKSFVSFLDMKVNPPIIDDTKLHFILSGISELTQDFKKQETVVETMLEQGFTKSLNNKSPEEIKQSAVEYTQKLMDEKILQLESTFNKQIEEKDFAHKNSIELLTISSVQDKLSFLNQNIKSVENVKRLIHEKIEKSISKFKLLLSLSMIGYVAMIIFLIYRFTWEVMEPITYILTGLFVGSTYIYLWYKEETFNPLQFINKRRKTVTDLIYFEENFDTNKLEQMKIEKEKFEHTLENMKKQL